MFVWIASFLAMTIRVAVIARNAFSRELAWRNPGNDMNNAGVLR